MGPKDDVQDVTPSSVSPPASGRTYLTSTVPPLGTPVTLVTTGAELANNGSGRPAQATETTITLIVLLVMPYTPDMHPNGIDDPLASYLVLCRRPKASAYELGILPYPR